jgi:hypothetical protein
MRSRLSCFAVLTLVLSLVTPVMAEVRAEEAPAISERPGASNQGSGPGAHLRINHIQARGTHNSYHRNPMWPQPTDWHYSHLPLEAQFEHQGVRQIELDIHYNWGRDDFEVYHVGIDARTTCELLTECLDQVKRWSDARPHHHPILILIEPKDGGPPRDSGLPEDGSPLTHPIREPEYEKVDELIRSHPIWERTLTPDDVTHPGRTLRESILTKGWPRIAEARGHVIFLVDGSNHGQAYSRNWTSLEGRTMFVQDNGTRATSAFVSRGGGTSRMAPLIRQGFMIRDLTGPSGFENSKAAGVQFISSDFPDELHLSDNEDAPSRCNPVSTEQVPCEDHWLETKATDPYPHEMPPEPEDTLAQSPIDHIDLMIVRGIESMVSCVQRACTPPVDRMLDL